MLFKLVLSSEILNELLNLFHIVTVSLIEGCIRGSLDAGLAIEYVIQSVIWLEITLIMRKVC